METLNFGCRVSVNVINGPREFEMKPGLENVAAGPSKALQQTLLSGFDENKARRREQNSQLRSEQQQKAFAQKLIKPRFRDFKAKLIVERMGHGGDNPFRLAKQADGSAFVERWTYAAFDARTVNL